MTTKKIMLVCTAGMSTSLLVANMQSYAQEEGIDVEITAKSAPEANRILEKENIDVILLGPQARYMLKQFEDKVSDKDIPVDVIEMQDYGMMRGEKVLQNALDLIKK